MTDPRPAPDPTTSAGRPWAPLAVAALATASLSLVAPAAGAAAPAAAPKARATITVTALDPVVTMPHPQVSAAGSVRNSGRQRLTGGEIRLRLSRGRLNSRAELAAAAAGRTSSAIGEIVARQRLPQRLDAGQDVRFDLTASLDDGGGGREFGVYALTLEVVAGSRDGFGRVGVVRTFVPWVPRDPAVRPTGFSWLWPLISKPTRRGDGTFVDDSLAQEMTRIGRLDRLVSAAESLSGQLPLTWVIDPSLLHDAQAMSAGYRVAGADGSTAQGEGAGLAAAWLERLARASAGQRVISLPYADPDVVSLRRRGRLDDVRAAMARQGNITTDLLGGAPVTDVAWPADGFADRATLSALRRLGFTAAILDSRAVEPELALSYTPSGRADIRTPNGRSTALLYDPVLTRTLGAGANRSPLLSVQRFLAETAMITAEQPSLGTERTILIAPPRVWSPSPELLSRLVEVLPGAAWMAGVSTESLAAAQPPEIDRKPVRYPASVRKRELSRPYLAGVQAMRESIQVFSSVLPRQPNPLILQFEDAVHRLQSSWWRGRSDRVNRLVEERRELSARRKQVRVLPGNYTFGSNSGVIPLTISNGLDQEVVVDVRLTPKTLLIEIGDVSQQRIAPESKIQVEVPAQARANGVVLVETSLQTPSGRPYDHPVQLQVRVTRYGTVALYITLGAAGVLMLAAIVRLARRGINHTSRRRREQRDATAGS